MPSALLDFQHELIAEGAAGGLVFGKAGTTYVTTEHPQMVAGDDVFGDVSPEREDGTSFGEDYQGSKSVVFELAVDTAHAANPHVAGADALEALEAAWKNPIYRRQSEAVAILRSRAVPGRTRRAYGRPRRYAETTSRLTHRGLSTVVCDFQTRDSKWYDDVEQSQSVISSLFGARPVVVGGTVETWPVITINGPSVNPTVTLGPWSVQFNGLTLLTGQSVTIDPRPWARSVLRNDGANLAGLMTSLSPPLRKCYLQPGNYWFGMIATGGTATVRWRSAYNRW